MAAKGKKRAKVPPHVALDSEKQKEFNQKTQQVKKKANVGAAGPGVIYISHLPWGFVEQPLRDFFRQFGKVENVRVSRSKKTGNSRGYAFVQFANVEVAKIAADTMNNYLMFDKLLKCKYLPDPHPDTFKGATKPFRRSKGPRKAIEVYNQPKSEAAMKKSKAKSRKKLNQTKKKLEDLGIDYSIEISGVTDPAVKVKEEPKSDFEDMEVGNVRQKVTTHSRLSDRQVKNRVKSSKPKEKDPRTDKMPEGVVARKEEDTSDVVVELKEELSETVPTRHPKRKPRGLSSRQNIKKQKR